MAQRNKKEFKTIEKIRAEIVSHFRPDITVLLKMEKEENIDSVFEDLERFLVQHARGITSTQLRNVFEIVRPSQNLVQLQLQRPRLAHIIAKQPWESAKYLMLLVDELVARADDVTKNGFPYFIETLVAFHRFQEAMNDKRVSSEQMARDLNRAFGNTTLEEILYLRKSKNINQILNGFQNYLQQNVKGITSTQLRNIFSKMLTVRDFKALKRLRPVLVYTAARQGTRESVKLIFLILELLKQVNSESDKKEFLYVIEVLVSLHKYEEGIAKKSIFPDKLQSEYQTHFKEYPLEDLLQMATKSIHDYQEIQEKLQEFVLPNRSQDGIKGSQFRRFFDAVLAAKTPNEIRLLRPLFLYTAARQSSKGAQKILLFFVELMVIMKDDNFSGFQAIMTDSLVFHRYFEEVKSAGRRPEMIRLG
jgi:CRISPR/Cas system CSM-associated protein Csm2 small subunit